jgi:hypothetical protein
MPSSSASPGAMALRIITFSITTPSIMTFSIKALDITTFRTTINKM